MCPRFPVPGARNRQLARWLGVDVGGRRKGFDVAVVGDGVLVELAGRLTVRDVVAMAEAHRPAVIGIDSPCACAPAGASSRPCERLLAASVCGIRWTPDAAPVHASDYYGWVVEGLVLHRALADFPAEVLEVFPTASWTRWSGPRAGGRRSVWTREALPALGLHGVPDRTNQDQRDAIAAAMTARQHSAGETEQIGDILVPRRAEPGARGHFSSSLSPASHACPGLHDPASSCRSPATASPRSACPASRSSCS